MQRLQNREIVYLFSVIAEQKWLLNLNCVVTEQ